MMDDVEGRPHGQQVPPAEHDPAPVDPDRDDGEQPRDPDESQVE